MKIAIVYDMDDTITRLNEYVLSKLGLDLNIMKRYNLEENNFSEDVNNKIMKLWADPETFKNTPFEEGLDYLVNVLSKDARLDFKIHSLSLNREIIATKYNRLLAIGFYKEQLHLDVGQNKDMRKSEIVVEDSLYNLYNSKSVDKILINRAHNQIVNYPEYQNNIEYTRANNLVEANKIVRNILQNKYNIDIKGA